ncbi:protein WVD2-like 5 [Sesbania bispinosa]|nr:protein WVD2-like 5 [Sesbania bispinosa]
MEAKLDNLERGFENLWEMMENINRNLQQKRNSTNPSGDSGNDADGNLGEGAGSRSGSIEDRWRRLEIPLFSGDDVYGWVSRIERTKVHLEIHDELFHKFQIVVGSMLQAIRILCKTFKQKLEAGLGELLAIHLEDKVNFHLLIQMPHQHRNRIRLLQLDVVEIPTTRAKSPKLGRRKSLTHLEPEGNASSNAQQGRLSLDEKVTPNNPTKGISPVHQKKPQRKSLPPRLTSERTSSSNSATARTSSKAVNDEKTSLSSVTTEVTALSNATGEEKVEMAAATEENNALSVETIEALRLNIEAGEAQSHVNGDLVIEEKPQITLVQEPITAGH